MATTTDLPAHRTSASALYEMLPREVDSIGPIVVVGRFEPGGSDTYAAFYVACYRAEMPDAYAYSTHRMIYNDERGDWLADLGHYDMTITEARADLDER